MSIIMYTLPTSLGSTNQYGSVVEGRTVRAGNAGPDMPLPVDPFDKVLVGGRSPRLLLCIEFARHEWGGLSSSHDHTAHFLFSFLSLPIRTASSGS